MWQKFEIIYDLQAITGDLRGLYTRISIIKIGIGSYISSRMSTSKLVTVWLLR